METALKTKIQRTPRFVQPSPLLSNRSPPFTFISHPDQPKPVRWGERRHRVFDFPQGPIWGPEHSVLLPIQQKKEKISTENGIMTVGRKWAMNFADPWAALWCCLELWSPYRVYELRDVWTCRGSEDIRSSFHQNTESHICENTKHEVLCHSSKSNYLFLICIPPSMRHSLHGK